MRPWSRFPRYLCVCLRSPLRRGCLLVEARAVHHTVLRAINHTEALQRSDDPWQTHTPCIISATTSMRYPRPPENRPTADGPAPMWVSPGADVGESRRRCGSGRTTGLVHLLLPHEACGDGVHLHVRRAVRSMQRQPRGAVQHVFHKCDGCRHAPVGTGPPPRMRARMNDISAEGHALRGAV